MKKTSILFIVIFCATSIFAQNVTKHPQNGKPIIISDNGNWAYKPETGSFKDSRDGKTYKTVTIGTQIWMAENLAYKASSGCWAYKNDSSYVEKYGYLYNWETAKDACPAGWHLASDEEWKTLERNMGMTEKEVNTGIYRGKDVGAKLKSTTIWFPYEGQNLGTNESGFNAVPGGIWLHNEGFNYDRGDGYWWTSTPKEGEHAWRRYIYNHSNVVGRNPGHRADVMSVRCIKD